MRDIGGTCENVSCLERRKHQKVLEIVGYERFVVAIRMKR